MRALRLGLLLLAATTLGCAADAGSDDDWLAGATGGTGPGGGGGPAPSGAFSLERAFAFGARQSACMGHDALGAAFEALLYGSPGGYPPEAAEVVDCVLAAGDCEAVLGCFGLDPAARCLDAYASRCADGETVESCTPLPNGLTVWQRWSCAGAGSGGPGCLEQDVGYDPEATCGVGPCDDDGAGSACDGSVWTDCSGGVQKREDCATHGLACLAPADEAAEYTVIGCAPNEEPCVDDTCDGDRLSVCFFGIVLGALDCRALGPDYRCTVDPEWGAGCAVPAERAECDEDGDVPRCEGDTARGCLGGRWVGLDCSAFLGATCVLGGWYDDEPRCKAPDWP